MGLKGDGGGKDVRRKRRKNAGINAGCGEKKAIYSEKKCGEKEEKCGN